MSRANFYAERPQNMSDASARNPLQTAGIRQRKAARVSGREALISFRESRAEMAARSAALARLIMADAAYATARSVGDERMALMTFCLPGVLRRHAVTTQGVLARRHWLQMVGVDATPHTATMVYLQPIRDGATKQLVHDAVGRPISIAPDVHSPVTVGPKRPEPQPAPRIWLGREALIHVIQERHGRSAPKESVGSGRLRAALQARATSIAAQKAITHAAMIHCRSVIRRPPAGAG